MRPASAALGRSLEPALTPRQPLLVVILARCAAALGDARFVTLEMLPSMTTQEERLDAVVAEAVGGDRDALRKVLETIADYVHAQGLAERRVKIEELFAPQTMDL